MHARINNMTTPILAKGGWANDDCICQVAWGLIAKHALNLPTQASLEYCTI